MRCYRSASLCSVFVLLFAAICSAQGTTVNAVRGRISERMVVGSTTLGDVLRIVGSPTIASGTGTINPAVIDADGDVLEDSFTTVTTAGAHTWGAAGQFSSTLGVTGAATLSSTLGVTGATTLSSTLSVTGAVTGSTGTFLLESDTRISNATPALLLHDSDAASSEKYTVLESNNGQTTLSFYDDTPSASNALFQVDRAGIVPSDWRWGSLLGTIRPENNGGSSLGALNKKYLTLHAWELWVQTLVAQNTIATIGGRIMVAPTTELTRDVLAADTTIYVKHNQARTNDTLLLQANGLFEKMLVTSNATDCAISGNCTVTGSDFKYTVTRNRDTTGANDWAAGSAALNEGNTGDGYIDIYSDRSATSEGYPGQVVSDGPVVYFRMDETSAGLNFDLTGSTIAAAETGTQSNGLGVSSLMWSSVSDALWENTGGAGYLTVNDSASLRITADLTIEFFAAWQRTTARDEIIMSRNHAGEYYIRVLTNGSIGFCHGNTSTFTCVDTAAGTMPNDSVGHHYAFVRDATSSPKRILFYKDGALHTQWTYTQAVATTTNNLLIGGHPALGNAFDGYLDEVAIYNYQVPADRIALHYDARSNSSISKFTVGPTLCGNVRTGTAAFDIAERWCLGNLAGTYDYSSTAARYGLAAGSVGAAWFGIDSTNGLRGMFGTTQKFGINASGVASFVEGAVTIDNLGIRITNTASTSDETKGFTFIGNATYTKRPGMFYHEVGGDSELVLSNDSKNTGTGSIVLSADVLSLTAATSSTINGSTTFSGTCSAASFTVVRGMITSC